ncbi:MAG TPA: diiron oxygenase [Ktedonobacteraceae bacterium]|jgi:hypothetical protein|nr:diiron oxygenase [Ktedonobacteraceae bacterium]
MDANMDQTSITAFVYESKLKDWYGRASVRVKPQRVLIDEEAEGQIYFPPELVPVSQHQLVRNLGEWAIRRVLIQRLYMYLEFTAQLEHDVVNRVAHQIAHQQLGVDLPMEMVLDAYKIYTDEAYHAQFSAELKYQIELATGVAPNPTGAPRCLRLLRELLLSVPIEMRQLAEVFFTIVSETLISAILSQIPRDKRIVGTVRLLVADHAEDEGRHHAYFAKLLEFLWPQLNLKQKLIIGPLLSRFVLAFLEPDYAAIECELAGCGLKQSEIQQIMQESYPHSTVAADIREAAKATLRLFERNGVFVNRQIWDAFQQNDLIS